MGASLNQPSRVKDDSLTPDDMPLEEAVRPEVARENIRRWVETVWNQLKK
jgi:glycerate kinase